MFKNRKNLISLFLAALIGLSGAIAPALADEVAPSASHYLFHLYYDRGQLFADRDFEYKYEIIPEGFESSRQQGIYKVELVNFLGDVAGSYQFDPLGGDPAFVAGKIKVRAPYIADGQRAVFYNSQGQNLLTISISETSFCNDDGFCDAIRGEDNLTCPHDCRSVASVSPTPPLGEGQESDRTGIIIAAVVFSAMAGSIAWYFVIRRRTQKVIQNG